MKSMFKCVFTALFAIFPTTISGLAMDMGVPVFGDSFDTPALLAEHWNVHGNVRSADGVLQVVGGASATLKRSLPDNFSMKVDVTLLDPPDPASRGHAGVGIAGVSCLVRPDGLAWLVYRLPTEQTSRGTTRVIPGFEPGKKYTITVRSEIAGDERIFIYQLDGDDVGVAKMPLTKEFSVQLTSYREAVQFDNFALYELSQRENPSPNMIINSSFGHLQEGMPTYYNTQTVRKNSYKTPYDQFLRSFAVDGEVKRGGERSLRLIMDDSCLVQGFLTHSVEIAQGKPATFSVWLKSSEDNLPVTLLMLEAWAKWHRKEIRVSREWTRYSISLDNVSHATMRFGLSFEKPGTLWVDELQAESGAEPTPYRPSDLDEIKFRGKSDRPAAVIRELAVNRLKTIPAMDGNLDSWKDHAWKTSEFYSVNGPAAIKTDAWLGCDDANLYVGVRAYVDDLGAVKAREHARDSFDAFQMDGIELFIDPGRSRKTYFHLVVSAGNGRVDFYPGRDAAWNGDWRSAVRLNPAEKSIDYELGIPFAMLANSMADGDWGLNIGRNDTRTGGLAGLMPMDQPNFHMAHGYPILKFPPGVLKSFALGVAESGITQSPDGRKTLSLFVDNNTGAAVAGEIRALRADDGAVLFASPVELAAGGNEIRHEIPRDAEAGGALLATLRSGEKQLFEHKIRPRAISPVVFYGKYPWYMDDAEAPFRVLFSLDNPGEYAGRIELGGQTVEFPMAERNLVAVPLKGLAEGTHAVTLTVSRGNETISRQSVELVKKPFRKGAARVNQFGRFVELEGKPVLAIMPLISGEPRTVPADIIDRLAENGFGDAMLIPNRDNREEAMSLLTQSQKRGMRVSYWSQFPRYKDEDIPAAVDMMNSFNHVFAHLIIDEPELYMGSEATIEFMRKIRPHFPHHPVFMNNTVLAIPNRFANLETDILMLDDYLTNRENRTVEEIVVQADLMWKAGEAERRPSWFFVVGNNQHNHYREPTYAEQISMAYGLLTANCTGIAYFLGMASYPENWRAMRELAHEFSVLENVVPADGWETPSARISDDTLRHMTRIRDGFVHVIIVNTVDAPAGGVTVSLPEEFEYDGKVEVLFEDRTLDLRDRRFADSFQPLARHVYRVRMR